MNKTALIIEDDEDLANIFAEALRGIGFEPENALNGKIAREKLQEGDAPFLILLDMHLPYISGQELLRDMKSDAKFNNSWIIISTSDARLAEQYRDQVDFALIKPVQYSQLKGLASRLKPKDEMSG